MFWEGFYEISPLIYGIFGISEKLSAGECDCPVQCERIKYSLQLSSAYFPSEHFWDTVYQLMNESVNENETDMLNQQIRSGSVYQLLTKSGTDTLQHEIRSDNNACQFLHERCAKKKKQPTGYPVTDWVPCIADR